MNVYIRIHKHTLADPESLLRDLAPHGYYSQAQVGNIARERRQSCANERDVHIRIAGVRFPRGYLEGQDDFPLIVRSISLLVA